MELAQTVLDPRDEAALRWYWCDAPGDLGERSHMAALIAALERGTPRSSTVVVEPDPTRRVEAARRYRALDLLLRRLDRRHVATLRATYGPGLPGATTQRYAPLASPSVPVALLLLTAHRVGTRRATFARWLLPPGVPSPRTHEERAARDQWERQRDAFLAPLLKAARSDRAAAAVAFNLLAHPTKEPSR